MTGTATRAYLMQRVTGAIMIPISLWMLFYLLPKLGLLILSDNANKDQILYEIFSPTTHITYILIFVFCGTYHGLLGMESVIKDYIHCNVMKKITTIAIYGSAIFTIVFLTIFSIDTHIQAISNFDQNKEVKL